MLRSVSAAPGLCGERTRRPAPRAPPGAAPRACHREPVLLSGARNAPGTRGTSGTRQPTRADAGRTPRGAPPW
eukprot:5232276-Prymnesium_polylepis.1